MYIRGRDPSRSRSKREDAARWQSVSKQSTMPCMHGDGIGDPSPLSRKQTRLMSVVANKISALSVARGRKSRIRNCGSPVRNDIIDCEPPSASADVGRRDVFGNQGKDWCLCWHVDVAICDMTSGRSTTLWNMEKFHDYRYERKRHMFPPVILHGCWGRRRRFVLFWSGSHGLSTVSSYFDQVFS
jgi:hypothetical protein